VAIYEFDYGDLSPEANLLESDGRSLPSSPPSYFAE